MVRINKAVSSAGLTLRGLVRRVQQRIPQPGKRIYQDAQRFWDATAEKNFLGDHSHWQGIGRWSKGDRWERIGGRHREMFEKLSLISRIDRPIQRMAEWGPGGGANAVHFCSEVHTLYGIDVSNPNLAECARQLASRGYPGFRPVWIDIRRPEDCLGFIPEPVDFFLSTAVFQHFPNKEYGFRVIKTAYQMLREGGNALIQVRYDDGNERYRCKRRNYAENIVTFTAYGIAEFWGMADRAGFHPLALVLDPSVHYAYFFLQK